MASVRRITKKYYFTVEGETERWYLEWLQDQINAEPSASFTVSIISQTRDPIKYAKYLVTVPVRQPTEVTHLMDYESDEDIHTKKFSGILDQMKEAQSLGKSIKYKLGYSNFTFELWMVLHKSDCNGLLTNRTQYSAPINRAYSERFEDLKQYKHEDNFKRILKKLTLTDVKNAIERARCITKYNQEKGYVLHRYRGYSYYRENPSLSIWETIEEIMRSCELL